MGQSTSHIPVILAGLPLQTQYHKNGDLGVQNNSTIESQLNQREDQVLKFPPLAASESLGLGETYGPQDTMQNSDKPGLPQHDRMRSHQFHLMRDKKIHLEGSTPCEPTCPG
jgi:hypothetical protein